MYYQVICIEDLSFSYKSWQPKKGVIYNVENRVCCFYCGRDCNMNIHSKHIPSYLVYNKQMNDFYNTAEDLFERHFRTMAQLREEKIDCILYGA
jgi:predicted metal-binding protein